MLSILALSFLGACNLAPKKEQSKTLQYFDLKGYIALEAKRLSQSNPEVDKSVMVNQSAEQKKVSIADWPKELSAFSDADINKSAWQGLFKVSENKDSKTYTSNEEKVPVKSLRIQYKNGRLHGIEVLIRAENSLYNSNDTLLYFPDSLYQIRKTQHIKLLNEKNYLVTGKF